MTVSRRLRFEILKRDGHACRYCGAKAPDVALTVDHVIPIALGGGDEPNNLVTACADCNSGKSSTNPEDPIVEDVDASAMLWQRAIEVAAERMQNDLRTTEQAAFSLYKYWEDYGRYSPADAVDTIMLWLSRGLSKEEIQVSMDATCSRSRNNYWTYLCGRCWGILRDRQELARRLIEDGEV